MRKNTAPSRESTTESDSRPSIKLTKYANVTLHFAAPPTPPKQYQCLTSAKSVSLFNSGEEALLTVVGPGAIAAAVAAEREASQRRDQARHSSAIWKRRATQPIAP